MAPCPLRSRLEACASFAAPHAAPHPFAREDNAVLERLAHLVIRRHKLVVAIWIVLTIFGAYSAAQVSDRWLEDFSIPGYSGYEANQRTLQALGNGEVYPFVAVLSTEGDVTQAEGVEEAIDAAAAANPGSRVS